MSIRLIASDLDDTLINSERMLSRRTLRAASRAMALGVRFVLASGRMLSAMRPFIRALGVNAPVIAYNGAAVFAADTGKLTHALPVDLETAREACRRAEESGLHVQAFIDDEYVFRAHNEFTAAYAQGIGIPGRALGEPLSRALDRPPLKLLIIADRARIDAEQPLFAEFLQDRANAFISKPIFLEITAPGADKGAALARVLADYGIDAKEAAAFGDAQNDLSMLKAVGFGVAVKNAREEAKAAARFIAPSNDEDGVARMIEGFIDGGQIKPTLGGETI